MRIRQDLFLSLINKAKDKQIYRISWEIQIVVYYESLNRELKTKPMYEFRCDERLKTKVEESTRLACTFIVVYYEPLKRALKTKSI